MGTALARMRKRFVAGVPVAPFLLGVIFTIHVAPRVRWIVHRAVRFAAVVSGDVVQVPRRVAAVRAASRAMVATRAAVMA